MFLATPFRVTLHGVRIILQTNFSIKLFTYLLISLKLFKDLRPFERPLQSFLLSFGRVISELGCKDTDFFITCKFFRNFFQNIFQRPRKTEAQRGAEHAATLSVTSSFSFYNIWFHSFITRGGTLTSHFWAEFRYICDFVEIFGKKEIWKKKFRHRSLRTRRGS